MGTEEQLTEEQAQAIWEEEAAKKAAPEETPPQPEAESEPEPEPQPEPQPEPEDPLAGLPPILREKLAKVDELERLNADLTQHVKRAEGRVASIQRQMQAAASQATDKVGASNAPTAAAVAAATKSPEKWDSLKADFPEWAEATEEYVASRLAGVSTGGQDPEQVRTLLKEEAGVLREQLRKEMAEDFVEEFHEGWKETVKSQDFYAWFSKQPAEIAALGQSERPRDAIKLISMFKQAQETPVSDIVAERAQRRSAAATQRPGGTPPAKKLEEMTPEELWKYEARQREKTREARGY
jgi:hypothetical protein